MTGLSLCGSVYVYSDWPWEPIYNRFHKCMIFLLCECECCGFSWGD